MLMILLDRVMIHGSIQFGFQHRKHKRDWEPCFSIAIEWTEGIPIPKFFILEDLCCVTSTKILP